MTVCCRPLAVHHHRKDRGQRKVRSSLACPSAPTRHKQTLLRCWVLAMCLLSLLQEETESATCSFGRSICDLSRLPLSCGLETKFGCPLYPSRTQNPR